MTYALALTALLATGVAGGAVAQQSNYLSGYSGGRGGGSILSAYGGGGSSGDYRTSLSRYGGSRGWGSGMGQNINYYAPTYSHSGWSNTNFSWARSLQNAWANRPLPAPCGNFYRAESSCRTTTTAWDPSFQTKRSW